MPIELSELIKQGEEQEHIRQTHVCAKCGAPLIRRQHIDRNMYLECYHHSEHKGFKPRKRLTRRDLWQGSTLQEQEKTESYRKESSDKAMKDLY